MKLLKASRKAMKEGTLVPKYDPQAKITRLEHKVEAIKRAMTEQIKVNTALISHNSQLVHKLTNSS